LVAAWPTLVFNQSLKVNYQPDTTQTIAYKTLRSKIRRETVINLFVNPLWDPLRDFKTRQILNKEVQRLRSFASRLQNELQKLSRLRNR
jgi:hypothetical protein